MNKTDNKKSGSLFNNVTLIKLLIVIVSTFFVGIYTCFTNRVKYIEMKELGKRFEEVFNINFKENVYTFLAVFIITYIFMYLINRGIYKGLKQLFIKENKVMIKIPNKSISYFVAIFSALIFSNIFSGKILDLLNLSYFGNPTGIFKFDYTYIICAFPIIKEILIYLLVFLTITLIYIVTYYIIVVNTKLEGIDFAELKDNFFVKQVRIILVFLFIIAILLNVIHSYTFLTGDMVKKQGIDRTYLTGAGKGDIIIKFAGYKILTILLIYMMIKINKEIKNFNFIKIFNTVLIFPIVLVGIHITLGIFNLVFVKRNELEIQKKYIEYNIEATEKSFGLDLKSKVIETFDELKAEDIEKNKEVLKKVPLHSKGITLKAAESKLKKNEPYQFVQSSILNTKEGLVYFVTREIKSGKKYTENGITYDVTHGIFGKLYSSNETTETGELSNLDTGYLNQKLGGKVITEPRIYYGLTTYTPAAVGKDIEEYDYPIKSDKLKQHFAKNKYNGEGGIKLNNLDKIIYGINTASGKLLFSNKADKFLINREIFQRVKRVLPQLKYEKNPYMVPGENGHLVWVIDAYTMTDKYPFAQKIAYKNEQGGKERINYIKNSVKVTVDAYDGTVNFYLVDENEPLARQIQNKYPKLFKKMDEMPNTIKENLLYPEFLFNMQKEAIGVYHKSEIDVLYRSEDNWENITTLDKNSNAIQKYTVIKNKGEKEKFGMFSVYTPAEGKNITAFLLGEVVDGKNTLSIYKYDKNDKFLSLNYMKNKIAENETIANETKLIRKIGTNEFNQTTLVPFENSILYIEPIYQIFLNENDVPILNSVVFGNGNKIGIGKNLLQSAENLFTESAIKLNVNDPSNLDSLIDALIKMNKNIKNPQTKNNLQNIGKNIDKISETIDQIEKVRKQEKKTKKFSDQEE